MCEEGGREGCIYLGIVLTDRPILMPRDDIPTQITPPGHRRLSLIAPYDETSLIALLRLHIHNHIQHHNRPQEAHSLLRHREQFGPVLVELHPFYRRVEIPYFDALARADVPETDGVVGGAGGEQGGARVDVDGPEGALVAVIGAEAFAVGGEPGADYLVFGAGEEDVAIFGVSVGKERVRVRGVCSRQTRGGGCLWGRWTHLI